MKRLERCKVCNKDFEVYMSRKAVTYCSVICKRADYKSWHPVCTEKYVRTPKQKVKKPRFKWHEATNEQKAERLRWIFEKNVIRKEGCWDWKTKLHPSGYAVINYDHHQLQAHRASWILHNGDIPQYLLVCHHCDNRRCTNPEHLFLGTHNDNIQDMLKKARRPVPFGEKSYFHKLTEEQVKEIKQLISLEVPIAKIARRFDISAGAIDAIKRGITWKNIS